MLLILALSRQWQGDLYELEAKQGYSVTLSQIQKDIYLTRCQYYQ